MAEGGVAPGSHLARGRPRVQAREGAVDLGGCSVARM
jgi:hypothetical protein